MIQRVAVFAVLLMAGLTACDEFVGPERPGAATPTLGQASAVVPDQYIVVLRGDVDPAAAADQIAAGRGGQVLFVYRHALNGFALRVPAPAADAIARDPRVLYVEPDRPIYAIQQTLPTGVNRIDADQNPTAKIDGIDERVDVDIAILDTGIDLDHPDLNVLAGSGTNCMDPGVAPDDGNSHGTHVAGSAAALDNDAGVVGVAPGARLWPVKVLSDAGSGTFATVICGIDFVTENAGAIEVANMSLGAQGQSDALRTALQNSVGAGVYYAVAAGNDGNDIYGQDGTFGTSDDFIPAAYPEVAAVSALADFDGESGGLAGSALLLGCGMTPDDTIVCFSNFSASVVAGNPVVSPGAAIDVAAPGVVILSTVNGGGTGTKSGTSMASPHVAGAAGLFIAANGRANDAAGVAAIRQALIDSGQPQSEWRGGASTNDPDGNLENLVYVADFAPPPEVTDIAITDVSAPSSVVQGGSVNVDVTVANVGNQDVGSDITVTLTESPDGTTFPDQTISGGLAAGGSMTLTFSWNTAGASLGTHTLTASHGFADDNASNDSNSASVTVEDAVTDIAVAAVSAPPSAVQGDVVSVDVTVENVGNQNVTADINVTLTESPDGTTFPTQTISGGLVAGASAMLTFSWNTTGAALGDHTLTASHDFADDDASNDSNFTTVTVQEEASTSHVGDLDGTSTNQGSTWTAIVTVTVHDGSHNPVADASVTGSWGAPVSTGASCTTDPNGQCTVSAGGIHKRNASVTFSVADVTHGTLTYDAAANHDPDGDSNGTSISVAKP